MATEIQEFGRLLQKFNKELIEYKATFLIGPGENYGSVMLAVEATVKEENNEEHLSMVAKCFPPNEFIQALFDTVNTFRKETAVYSDMVPRLKRFQEKHDMQPVLDMFPKYIASRLNIDLDSHVVDKHAVLVLENLKTMGYTLGDRYTGLNFETSKLVLESLARFQGVALAYRLRCPDEWQEHFMPHLDGHATYKNLPDSMRDTIVDQGVEVMEQCPTTAPLAQRFRVACRRTAEHYIAKSMPKGGVFATLTHNDLWTNNTMVKWAKDGRAEHCHLVDHQMIDLGNPCNDVVFFLFSSVDYPAMERLDDLIRAYYETFVGVLSTLGCDTKPYSFEEYLKRIECAAKSSQVFHLTHMFKPILMRKDNAVHMAELNEDVLLSMRGLDHIYYDKIRHTVREFAKRNWI